MSRRQIYHHNELFVQRARRPAGDPRTRCGFVSLAVGNELEHLRVNAIGEGEGGVA